MPRRDDVHKVMIIGSGPIIIGQACEFDYSGTQACKAVPILKLHEGRPNIEDAVRNGEIHLIVNTPSGKWSEFDDSYIRKTAVRHKVPYITTPAAALAAARGIVAARGSGVGVRSLQSYHADIG